jgi:hypothetical protein
MALPAEIWILIALTDSSTYNLVIRSNRALYNWAIDRTNQEQLKKHWLKFNGSHYHLPNGWLHRTDGPAIIHLNGVQTWYYDNKIHRDGGPAVEAITFHEYWQHGLKHRINGPAIDALNRKEYWIDGMLHREDGPAIIGSVYVEYWLNGKFISRKFY